MTVPFTIPHDADAIANSISKVVNAQSTGTLASNANLANNSVIKSYIDTAVANQLTTIKTDFRPKYARATYTGGGSVELRRRTVENKPEFDGRFFVKVLSDDLLKTAFENASIK